MIKGGEGIVPNHCKHISFFFHLESLFIFHLFISHFFKSSTEAITFKNCFWMYNSCRPGLSRLRECNHFASRWTPSKESAKESVCCLLLLASSRLSLLGCSGIVLLRLFTKSIKSKCTFSSMSVKCLILIYIWNLHHLWVVTQMLCQIQ